MPRSGKKLVLVEINEITWDLIDPLIQQGKLPTFAWLKQKGTWASPMSVEMPPQLDPWITWTTVYTGRPQTEHNLFFLQQPPETIKAKRIWEICNEQGLKVGVYGSLCSWPPPREFNGYYIPDTFSQDFSTHPAKLQPIQELNLTYTRSIRLPADRDNLLFKIKLGSKLTGLGLKPSTMTRIMRQLARERLNPAVRWQRVVLQPFVNFDFFERLYRRYQPDFASFHTNHVAHYMHTYWKAMKPEIFPQETSAEEVRTYGRAVEFGYQSADELLSRVVKLVDENTVLMIASSMGQQPFISDLKKGKAINQLKSLDRLMQILGVEHKARALSTMSDQFNIYADDPATVEHVVHALEVAYVDKPSLPMFVVKRLESGITATLKRYDEIGETSRIYFPHLGDNNNIFQYDDLVYSTGMVKSGFHHPKGMMILYGAGVRAGGTVDACNNLDLAPTMLTILGLPVPDEMKGRVLHEALIQQHTAAAISS